MVMCIIIIYPVYMNNFIKVASAIFEVLRSIVAKASIVSKHMINGRTRQHVYLTTMLHIPMCKPFHRKTTFHIVVFVFAFTHFEMVVFRNAFY